jgi:hypothetical protein
MYIQNAFDAFMSDDFQSAVDSSTKASWYGHSYSVELFDDGSYRLLHSKDIGTLYDSPGLILVVPSLSDEEWHDDPTMRCYDAAEQEIRDYFEDYCTSGRWQLKTSLSAIATFMHQ